MAYISFGIFASSITENQIIAGTITIAFFLFTWFAPDFSTMFIPFSLVNLFDNFLLGIISVSNIFTYVTFTVTFIILTIISLKRRRSV